MNIEQLVRQAQMLQAQIEKKDIELSMETYEVSVGGGIVRVQLYGDYTIEQLDIDASILDKKNKEEVQDLIKSAINQAMQKAYHDKEKVMHEITGDMKLPKGF